MKLEANMYVHFGLGCIQFLRKQETVEELNINQYCTQIDQTLRSIYAVSEINIEKIDQELSFSGEISSLRDGFYLFPASGITISFNIHIPLRVQEEIGRRFYIRTDTEDFHILIRHEFWSPVAMIKA